MAVLALIARLLAIGGRTLNQQRPTYRSLVKKQEFTLRSSTLVNYLNQFDSLPMMLIVSLPKIQESDT